MSKTIAEPTLNKDEILGIAGVDSPAGKAQQKDYETAKDALARADAAELFTLYERAIRDRNELAAVFTRGMSHFIGSSDKPRYEPASENVIASMERVALAAIELARAVAVDGKGK